MSSLTRASVVESQADVAYRAIYQLILRSRDDDSVVWFERQLGEQLQLGRTPTREALKRLQNEGLLVPVSAHGGLAAATISSAEVEHVYQLRAALEALAARLAAGRSAAGEIARVDIDELRRRDQALHERAAARDMVGLSEENHNFHAYIVALAGNPFLEEALNRLWSRIQISSMSNFVDDDAWIDETHNHHDELVELIASGDAERAEVLARLHIDRAREVYLHHQLSRGGSN